MNNNSVICIGSRHDPDDDNQSATNSYKNSSFRMHKCNTCRGIAVMNASEAALNVKLKLRLLDRNELDRIVSKSLFKFIFFLSMDGL